MIFENTVESMMGNKPTEPPQKFDEDNSPKAKTSAIEEDEEIDPLDAFMSSIQQVLLLLFNNYLLL